jgi:hypothetical protein
MKTFNEMQIEKMQRANILKNISRPVRLELEPITRNTVELELLPLESKIANTSINPIDNSYEMVIRCNSIDMGAYNSALYNQRNRQSFAI